MSNYYDQERSELLTDFKRITSDMPGAWMVLNENFGITEKELWNLPLHRLEEIVDYFSKISA